MSNDATIRIYQAKRHEMRALVDSYDTIQDLRKGADNKRRAYEQGYDIPSAHVPTEDDDQAAGLMLPEPVFMRGIRDDLGAIEDRIAKYLEQQAKKELLGRWMMSIDGIGGVLAAGMLAFVDFHRCCCKQYSDYKGKERNDIPVHDCPGLLYAGNLMAFAGMLDKKKQPWEKGQRCPYNARLKTHLWKISDQFRRCSVSDKKLAMSDEEFIQTLRNDKKYAALDDDELLIIADAKRSRMEKRLAKLETRPYARLYMERKERDTKYNEEGRFAEKAAEMLESAKKRKRVSAEQKKWWSKGMLQPCGIDLRAMRYAATIFLSHFHQIGREIYFGDTEFGKRTKPWIIEHGGHSRYIPPPNWPMK